MTPAKYQPLCRAVQKEGDARKEIAEQLFLLIPPVGKGRRTEGTRTVEQQLREAAEVIEQETGEKKTVKTLDLYRKVAMWVAEETGWKRYSSVPFPWLDTSWTAHKEAYLNKKAVSWADFSAGDRTKREVRQQAGKSTGDVPAAARAINAQPDEAAKLVAGLSEDAKAVLSEQLGSTTVERLPIEAALAQQSHARGQITEKIHEALNLLVQVNSDWSDYEASVNLMIIHPMITRLRVEIGLLEFSAGIETPLDQWRPEQ